MWPFCNQDLKSLGAKSFYGKFCTGAIDHVSIRRLQLILAKVCLLLGVEFELEVIFKKLEQIKNGSWRAKVSPYIEEIEEISWDGIVDGSGGSANTAKLLRKRITNSYRSREGK